MTSFMQDGGWGMYPVLLLGIVTLAAAAVFAFRADPKGRGFIDAMARSIVCFTVTSVVANFSAVGRYLETVPRERYAEVFVMGARESVAPVVLGFAFLAVIYLFVAIGQRRVDARS